MKDEETNKMRQARYNPGKREEVSVCVSRCECWRPESSVNDAPARGGKGREGKNVRRKESRRNETDTEEKRTNERLKERKTGNEQKRDIGMSMQSQGSIVVVVAAVAAAGNLPTSTFLCERL